MCARVRASAQSAAHNPLQQDLVLSLRPPGVALTHPVAFDGQYRPRQMIRHTHQRGPAASKGMTYANRVLGSIPYGALIGASMTAAVKDDLSPGMSRVVDIPESAIAEPDTE